MAIDLKKLEAAVVTVKSMPEVTQDEAMAAFNSICANHDEDCPDLRQILAEIVGFSICSADPEMTRRFVVFESYHGPISGC